MTAGGDAGMLFATMPTPPLNASAAAVARGAASPGAYPAGTVPTLADYLVEAHRKRWLAAIRAAGGDAAAALDPAVRAMQTVRGFAAFADSYLSSVNPAVGTFFAAVGLGLVLSNGDRVTLARQPGAEPSYDSPRRRGAESPMQPSGDVPITSGEGLGAPPPEEGPR